MVDLLENIPRSSEVKVVCKGQVKRKMLPTSGSIVSSTAQYLSFLLLNCKAGAPRTEHYQLVRALSAGAVVTVL